MFVTKLTEVFPCASLMQWQSIKLQLVVTCRCTVDVKLLDSDLLLSLQMLNC